MERAFEDVFSEIQADMISLCVDLLKRSAWPMDWIYAYCRNEESSSTFDAFFVGYHIVARKEDQRLGFSLSDLEDFLRIGIGDTVRLKQVCAEYGRPCPVDVYMIYNVKTGQFQAECGYDPNSGSSGAAIFRTWYARVLVRQMEGQPAGMLPTQMAAMPSAFQHKPGGVWDRIMRRVEEAKAKRKK